MSAEKKKNQQELAEKISVSRHTICNIEAGEGCCAGTAIKLADYFDVSIDSLFGRDHHRKVDPLAQRLIQLYKKMDKKMLAESLDQMERDDPDTYKKREQCFYFLTTASKETIESICNLIK